MQLRGKTIALYDANQHGHHLTYQKLISKMLLEEGCRVWLLCSNPQDVLDWLADRVSEKKLNRLITARISVTPANTAWQKQTWGIRSWIYAARRISELAGCHQAKPDLVLFLKVDDLVKNKGLLNGKIIDHLFPFDWAGIYIHLRLPKKQKSNMVNRLLYRPFLFARSQNLKAIGILQEDAQEDLNMLVPSPVVVLPDMTDESAPVVNQLSENIKRRANGRKIVGLVGGQDRRKGSFLFLDIAKRCAHKEWLFLFAGKMNYPKSDRELAELRSQIREEKNWENCYFHFERIADEEHFNAVIDICDVLFAVYRNFPFSSNLMTKAALLHKPIVVSAGSLMEARVKQYDIGIGCDPENLNECIDAIDSALHNPFPDQHYEKYYHQHSSRRFLECLRQLVKYAVN